ncbi:hypothetical protein N7478_010926 [Penicillium angulare]|uniref:uncharacterized protein n=1 Tax=Penicillium angulare TaxID=116970 RepID=UPI002540F693|nr:uncharacterized protein N7478_010926 [Penicillium angulare]KAJ5263321.1 hypothetical protein N7478_010926 [Penicillium angulare]
MSDYLFNGESPDSYRSSLEPPAVDDSRVRIEGCMMALLDGDNSRRIGLSTPAEQGDNRPGKSDATTERVVNSNVQLSGSLFEDSGMPEDVFMAVIDAYYQYCHNQPYSFFHEENFRQRLRAQMLAKHLVLTVVATAVRFCPVISPCIYR